VTRSDRDERISRLRDAAHRKSQDAVARANRAIIALENRGQHINFNTVAAEASVSKDFLYSHEAIRAQIINKRASQSAGFVAPAAQRASNDSNAIKLNVATEALRRLREENSRLRQENAQLRGELLTAQRSNLDNERAHP